MFLELNLQNSTLFSRNTIRLGGIMLALLGPIGFCQVGIAQNGRTVPIAHLVSEPVSELSRPRPRLLSTVDVVPRAEAALAASPSLDDATTIERRAFDRTNEERAKALLAPLAWDAELCRMARVHSENMARLGFFGHETPEGLRLKERARSMGILHFRVIAENIAYNKGYEDPGAFAVERWMISAGHRANILYVGFQTSAIGSYVSKDGSVYLTQVFLNR